MGEVGEAKLVDGAVVSWWPFEACREVVKDEDTSGRQ
jgi:hypothetical protein